MPNRLDIEITSQSTESSYTWRSAGAKEPKGTIKASLLPSGVAIGDVLKVEADFMLDGIEITAVLPQKIKKGGPELLELLGTGTEAAGVTTSLVKKSSNRKRRKDARVGPRNKQAKDRKQSRSSKAKSERKDRKSFRSPRGKRLKPSKKYRNEYIESLPELQKPIAKELSGSTIPNLRRTIEKMDLPEGFPDALLDYAENLNQQLKMAEWMDKATAVENNIENIDLQDFRSVVASSARWAKSSDSIAIKERLELKLNERIEQDHKKWLKSIEEALQEEKTVRALNLSSRSPKAGAQLPEAITTLLIEQANKALNAEATAHRWSIVAEAVAFSPVRQKITPDGLPTEISEELKQSIEKHGDRIPQIAKVFTLT
ncbi:MAG: hypothetical protein ACPG7Y_08170 [Acidimicrobiales bacterium]